MTGIVMGFILVAVFIRPVCAQQADGADFAFSPDAPAIVVKPGESTVDTSGPGQPDEQINYSLGPEDVIEISVARHSEFSGIFPVNQEGKIQYKFIGDLDVNGYTKKGA